MKGTIQKHTLLNRRKFSLLLFILLGFVTISSAQQAQVEVIADNRLSQLVEKHIILNKHRGGVMEGYRVQIFFDSGAESKKRAMETKSDFQLKFPDIPSYLSFSEPFFKIRVGDYRHKVEADGLLHRINTVYPNAFIVRDKISFPRID